MAKVGKYYEMLAASVDKGQLSDAAEQAEAIAALGVYLAPHRDPAMPPAYVTRQAECDEAARELALAARLRKVQEVSERFNDMTAACRNCHAAFGVRLEAPYKDLGLAGR
jgi:galactokinase